MSIVQFSEAKKIIRLVRLMDRS